MRFGDKCTHGHTQHEPCPSCLGEAVEIALKALREIAAPENVSAIDGSWAEERASKAIEEMMARRLD